MGCNAFGNLPRPHGQTVVWQGIASVPTNPNLLEGIMTATCYIVVCRDDNEPEGPLGEYVLATRRTFAAKAEAIRYASQIAPGRVPIVVECPRGLRYPEQESELLKASRALLDWGRENTSPRDANTPHELLIALQAAIENTAPKPTTPMQGFFYRHGLVVVINSDEPGAKDRAQQIAVDRFKDDGVDSAPELLGVATLPKDGVLSAWDRSSRYDRPTETPDQIRQRFGAFIAERVGTVIGELAVSEHYTPSQVADRVRTELSNVNLDSEFNQGYTHIVTPGWVKVEAYGHAFRLGGDECLQSAPINRNGTIDEESIDYPSPHDGVEDCVHKVNAIMERYLLDSYAPEQALIKAYLENPDAFEGEAGDMLPIVCEHCNVRFGSQCEHF
jgi:hypothetical protein